MWSYSSEENEWLSTNEGVGSIPLPKDITYDTIQMYIARGRYLRACYSREIGGQLMAALRRLFAKAHSAVGSAGLTVQLSHDLRTPLTSIRSYCEILRNHPNLSQVQRARYLDIILSESRRLERVINTHEAGVAASPSH